MFLRPDNRLLFSAFHGKKAVCFLMLSKKDKTDSVKHYIHNSNRFFNLLPVCPAHFMVGFWFVSNAMNDIFACYVCKKGF